MTATPLRTGASDVELRAETRARLRPRSDRVYGITATRGLFGDWSLLIAWGNAGAPLRRRVETFDSEAAMLARRDRLLARRRCSGYVTVYGVPPMRDAAGAKR